MAEGRAAGRQPPHPQHQPLQPPQAAAAAIPPRHPHQRHTDNHSSTSPLPNRGGGYASIVSAGAAGSSPAPLFLGASRGHGSKGSGIGRSASWFEARPRSAASGHLDARCFNSCVPLSCRGSSVSIWGGKVEFPTSGVLNAMPPCLLLSRCWDWPRPAAKPLTMLRQHQNSF